MLSKKANRPINFHEEEENRKKSGTRPSTRHQKFDDINTYFDPRIFDTVEGSWGSLRELTVYTLHDLLDNDYTV